MIERYAGRPECEMIADVEQSWRRAVPPEYFTRLKSRVNKAYEAELRALPGVGEMLDRLRVPVCVASSAHPEKLKLGLESTGLYERFAPNVISASLVSRGKPAPDVFIYAAGWMRMPIGNCLVVEDSLAGVRAARAAGIRVIGFTGGAHCPRDHAQRLMAAGAARVINHFDDLDTAVPEVIQARSRAQAAEREMEAGVRGE